MTMQLSFMYTKITDIISITKITSVNSVTSITYTSLTNWRSGCYAISILLYMST